MKRDAARDADTNRARMAQDDAQQQQLFRGGTVDQAARKLALDVLDWEQQFGPTNPKTDACCEVAPEDFARWVALAREVVGR